MKPDPTDLRNQPAYGPAEAARYLRLPAATLRTWLVGRVYPKGDAQATFQPLIRPAGQQPLQLSFYNLIEAHVLRALRTEHGVALAELRAAMAYAQKKLKVQRLLLSPELRTHAGQVFLDRSKGISTAAIADRIDAGESVDALADDHDLSRDEIEQAVVHSRAA